MVYSLYDLIDITNDTSNLIKKIDTNTIVENEESSNRFIIHDSYIGDITIEGNLNVGSGLFVNNSNIIIKDYIYTKEQVNINISNNVSIDDSYVIKIHSVGNYAEKTNFAIKKLNQNNNVQGHVLIQDNYSDLGGGNFITSNAHILFNDKINDITGVELNSLINVQTNIQSNLNNLQPLLPKNIESRVLLYSSNEKKVILSDIPTSALSTLQGMDYYLGPRIDVLINDKLPAFSFSSTQNVLVNNTSGGSISQSSITKEKINTLTNISESYPNLDNAFNNLQDSLVYVNQNKYIVTNNNNTTNLQLSVIADVQLNDFKDNIGNQNFQSLIDSKLQNVNFPPNISSPSILVNNGRNIEVSSVTEVSLNQNITNSNQYVNIIKPLLNNYNSKISIPSYTEQYVLYGNSTNTNKIERTNITKTNLETLNDYSGNIQTDINIKLNILSGIPNNNILIANTDGSIGYSSIGLNELIKIEDTTEDIHSTFQSIETSITNKINEIANSVANTTFNEFPTQKYYLLNRITNNINDDTSRFYELNEKIIHNKDEIINMDYERFNDKINIYSENYIYRVENNIGIKQIAMGRDFMIILLNNGIPLTYGSNLYGQLGTNNNTNNLNNIGVSTSIIDNLKNENIQYLRDGLKYIRRYGYQQYQTGTFVETGVHIDINNMFYSNFANCTEYNGYFYTNNYSGNFTFSTRTDDESFLWINNILVVNNGGNHGQSTAYGTISLNAKTYYSIRIQWGNNGGNGGIEFVRFSHANISERTDGTGFYYHLINDNNINIKNVACGNRHSVFLSNDGRVYSCGYNEFGQLGNGSISTSTTHQNYPITVNDIDSTVTNFSTQLTGVSSIACGDNYTVFLKSNGKVYSCGENANGKMGVGSTASTKYPVAIDLKCIVQIACGEKHTLFLNTNGEVYSCGYNPDGRLGIGSTNNKNTPYLLNINNTDSTGDELAGNYIEVSYKNTYSKISCGYNHSLILNMNQNVYTFGNNSSGQLGDGTISSSVQSPTLIITPYNIINVVGSWYSSFVIDDIGIVYACGDNRQRDITNILGCTSTQDNLLSFTKCIQTSTHSSNIQNIYTSIYHDDDNVNYSTKRLNIFVNENEEILYYGSNNFINSGKTYSIENNFDTTDFQYYNQNDLKYNMILKKSTSNHNTIFDDIYFDNLRYFDYIESIGYPDFSTYLKSSNIDETKITKVSYGQQHCVFLHSNAVYGFGNSNVNNVNSVDYNPTFPLNICKLMLDDSHLTNIIDVSCGDFHTLFLTNDNIPYACGYNKMGQLGIKSIEVLVTNPSLVYCERLGGGDEVLNQVERIFAGGNSSFFVKKEDAETYKTFSCGYNRWGQLGIGSTVINTYNIEDINVNIANIVLSSTSPITAFSNKIIDIKIGKNHTMMLAENGQVYCCGLNLYNELGVANKDALMIVPTLISKVYNQGNSVSVVKTPISKIYTHSKLNKSFIYS